VRERSERPERCTQLKGSVISKCANPSCSVPFRSLHDGRLFCFTSGSEAMPWTEGIPFRWLCSGCCLNLTLGLNQHGELMLISTDGTHQGASVLVSELH
jgi:hypothetical protein